MRLSGLQLSGGAADELASELIDLHHSSEIGENLTSNSDASSTHSILLS